MGAYKVLYSSGGGNRPWDNAAVKCYCQIFITDAAVWTMPGMISFIAHLYNILQRMEMETVPGKESDMKYNCECILSEHWDGTYCETLLCIAYVICRGGIVWEWCLFGASLCILLHIASVEVRTEPVTRLLLSRSVTGIKIWFKNVCLRAIAIRWAELSTSLFVVELVTIILG